MCVALVLCMCVGTPVCMLFCVVLFCLIVLFIIFHFA